MAMAGTLLSFLLVGFGGALGAMSRYGLTVVTQRYSDTLPLGTLMSNLAGCFIMGVLIDLLTRATWWADGGLMNDHRRLLFGVGFCGAFTTLSSLVVEVGALMQREQQLVAFAYLVLTLAGGFACFLGGAALARTV